MRRYKAYKDSGVEWIGEIPSHWGCIKIKHLLKERVEKSADGIGEPLSMSQKFGLIPNHRWILFQMQRQVISVQNTLIREIWY